MPDMSLTCRDCGQTFTFTEGEQDFYNTKGYSQPSRCASCRAAKKAARNNSDYGDSGYGDSYGNSGGYSSRGGGGSGGGRGDRQMTQVTCSSCGRPAEVPFVPSGDRPVYCSDCFSQQGGGSRGGGRSSSRY
ncbi:MAG TPA: CxxC-x17-CxxC domain-containing protein [Chloroflexia bacterium]|nr:CxxC-x17-CxxC domain-containing protein [Chloroflexia bacterium]